jgi:CTP-dependent riboflavin kinase
MACRIGWDIARFRCYPVSVDGRIDAAIVLPEVAGYSPVQVEIIATVKVRDVFGIGDGDLLRLKIGKSPP